MIVKSFLGVVLLSAVVGVSAAVPNKSATVTAIANGTAGCAFEASAQVKGTYTNSALQAMAVSSIYMEGQKKYNKDLSKNPPHAGAGKGSASITQVGVATVTSDAEGNVSVSVNYTESRNTTPCEDGE